MGKTDIEWCDFSFNPWWGCQRVSPGCEHCYAETMAKRTGHAVWGPASTTPRRFFGASYWEKPFQWDVEAQRAGVRRRVFCASMADVFEGNPSVLNERNRLWLTIAATPFLDWLLLTKRPENIARFLPEHWDGGWPNVWLGTTAENQEYAEKRIPHLLAVPAAVHFLSAEPLLGPVNLQIGDWLPPAGGGPKVNIFRPCVSQGPSISWVICGGESGGHARPMHPDWARSLRDQCQAAGVAFHFKQWGEWVPRRNDQVRYGEFHGGANWVDSCMCSEGTATLYRVGKHHAGRLLDGVEWSQFPRGSDPSAEEQAHV